MKNNALQNTDNYNKELDCDFHEVYNKYISILNEYVIHHLDIINSHDGTKPSVQTMRSQLMTGIQCLSHVFKMILLYTKNIQLTIYHSQRAFYFYVEFMEQTNDETHTFLQLTPKDACLFVYKKTIYEIDCGYKSTFKDDATTNDIIIDNIIHLYSGMVKNAIETNDDPLTIIKTVNTDIDKVVQHIHKLYHKLHSDNNAILLEKTNKMKEYIYYNTVKNNDFKPVEKYIKGLKK